MTARAIFFSQLRGACPGLSAPLPTGDGLLVRMLPIGTIPLEDFGTLCGAAREHGNGVVEITTRGSVQIRGLSAESAPRFADAIAALNIAAADGIRVLSNVLAGLDPEEVFDAGALAADLRRALAQASLAARLAPKVSVVVDSGGALALDKLAADVRLRAEQINGRIALLASVGGDGTNSAQLGAIAPADGAEAAMRMLGVIAQYGRDARARDILAVNGADVFLAALADLVPTPAHPRTSADPEMHSRLSGNERTVEAIGTHRLRDGSLACGVGLAFGHADASALEHLADAAETAGAKGMRAAPDRTLMIIGVPQEVAPSLATAAERLGFIVGADDARRRVIACAGAPVCASAHIATRTIAPGIAATAAPFPDGAFTIHLSGCAKGCAHAGTAALTVVGSPDGCELIASGSTRDTPFATVAADALPPAIRQYARERRREDGHV
jgi:precorrin-3B synthase